MASSGFLTVQGLSGLRSPGLPKTLGTGEEKKEQSSETTFEEQAVHLYPSSAFVKRRLCKCMVFQWNTDTDSLVQQ